MTSSQESKPDRAETAVVPAAAPPGRRGRWPLALALALVVAVAVAYGVLRKDPVRASDGAFAAASGAAASGPDGRGGDDKAADGRGSGAGSADRKKGGDPKPPPPVVVTTAAVRQSDVPVFRTGIGTVTAAQTVTVRARVDGQLERIGFVEGQDVKAGQLLAQLDPRTLQAQLAQVQAQKGRDLATLNNARVDLQRYQTLIAEEASTQQQLDTQKALVAQLEAAVRTDDAQIAYAQTQLSFTTILAPISGRVGARLVDQGNIVRASDTNGIVVINQIDPITVLFTLPEDAFQEVNRAINQSRDTRGGGAQALTVQAFPRTGADLLGTGKLLLVNNQIDTANGTVQLKGQFANPNHTLWPGQFVNIRLVLGRRQDGLTIPAAAVQRGQDGTYTYVVAPDGQTVQNRPIQVAQIQDGYAVIETGLEAGQKVVVDGQYKLRPGSAIVEAAPKKAGAASASGRGASAAGSGTDRHAGGSDIAATQAGAQR